MVGQRSVWSFGLATAETDRYQGGFGRSEGAGGACRVVGLVEEREREREMVAGWWWCGVLICRVASLLL